MVLPLALLEKSLEKRVVLTLKDRRIIEGVLSGFDEHMNLVLDDVEERFEERVRRIGTIILRGSNVVSISLK